MGNNNKKKEATRAEKNFILGFMYVCYYVNLLLYLNDAKNTKKERWSLYIRFAKNVWRIKVPKREEYLLFLLTQEALTHQTNPQNLFCVPVERSRMAANEKDKNRPHFATSSHLESSPVSYFDFIHEFGRFEWR